MKRSALQRKAPLKASGPLKRRRRGPKMTPARAAARDQHCTLRLQGCTNVGVVLCHLRLFGGGGMGLKPHDSEAVFGCFHCHNVLDGRIQAGEPIDYERIMWALIRTLRLQREAGVLIFKGEDA